MLRDPIPKQGRLLVYTRQADETFCTPLLANSIHFAYSRGGAPFEPLNRNYGIVFPKATVRETNALNEKGVVSPWIFRTRDGRFGLLGVRVDQNGAADEESRGCVLVWTSDDLVHFHEEEPLRLSQTHMIRRASCVFKEDSGCYLLEWEDETGSFCEAVTSRLAGEDLSSRAAVSRKDGFPEISCEVCAAGKVFKGNILPVDASFGEGLSHRWSPLHSTEVRFPDRITARSADDLDAVKADVFYSDGSSHAKRVAWDLRSVDFNTPGDYPLAGTVIRKSFPFPLAKGYADPDIMIHNGKYYYLATNDNEDFIGLYMREADTVDALFEEGYREVLILDKDEERGFLQTFWAPEFHWIGDDLYILFAVSGRQWGPQCHMMKFKGPSFPIADPDSWEIPKRVVKKDGRPIAGEDEDISLDMTHFKAAGKDYVAWSYRHLTGKPEDSGSMICLSTVDPEEPWRLTAEPVLLTRPLYGWENQRHTINNEGPNAIVTEDKIFLAYSGGAAGGYSYVIGMLTAEIGSDLLDPENWVKENAPVLAYPFSSEFGAGHNSFYQEKNGDLMLTFHAEEEYIVDGGLRCSGIRRIHFDIHGCPRFDMEPERDLDPALENVRTVLFVPER